MWLIYKYPYQKLLPEAKQYRFKLPNARITAGIFFAFLHLSNWKTALFGGLLFSFVYIITQNIAVSMLMHMAANLSTILLPGLSGIYLLLKEYRKSV
jgi:membrane protease YdiL (CAAX protease family)